MEQTQHRKKLIKELSEKGFAKQQLQDFQRILNAEKSDLYDILAYIAFNADIIEKAIRADKANTQLGNYEQK